MSQNSPKVPPKITKSIVPKIASQFTRSMNTSTIDQNPHSVKILVMIWTIVDRIFTNILDPRSSAYPVRGQQALKKLLQDTLMFWGLLLQVVCINHGKFSL